MISLLVGVLILIVVMILINKYLPIDGTFKNIINLIVGVALIIWIIYALFGHGGHIDRVDTL